MANAIEFLKKFQATQKEYTPVGCVCGQLMEMAQRDARCAEILGQDFENAEMSPKNAEQKIHDFADEIHKKTKGNVAVPPEKAEEILRKFYGLPPREQQEPIVISEAPRDDMADLLALLEA